MAKSNRDAIIDDVNAILENEDVALNGFILTSKQLSTMTAKLLASIGINENAIGPVLVGVQPKAEDKLRVLVNIRKDALRRSRNEPKTRSITDFILSSNRDTDSNKIDPQILKDMKYKFYRNNLICEPREKYFRMIFDPSVLIAYMFNIEWENKKYVLKIIDPKKEKKENNKDKDNKRKKFLAKNGLRDCGILVLYPKNNNGYNEERIKEYEDNESK